MPPDSGLLRWQDMAALLESGTAADMTFKVEDEEMKVHRIILQVKCVPHPVAGRCTSLPQRLPSLQCC